MKNLTGGTKGNRCVTAKYGRDDQINKKSRSSSSAIGPGPSVKNPAKMWQNKPKKRMMSN